MSENLQNIDDLFKKAIDGYEDTPSQNVWDSIDKNLDKKKVVSISKKYNKLKWAAAVVLLFSFAMAMYTVQTRIKNRELVRQNKMNKASEKYREPKNKIEKKSTQSENITPDAEKNNGSQKNKQIDAGDMRKAKADSSYQIISTQNTENSKHDLITKQNEDKSKEVEKINNGQQIKINKSIASQNEKSKANALIIEQNQGKYLESKVNSGLRQEKNIQTIPSDKKEIKEQENNINSLKNYFVEIPPILKDETTSKDILQLQKINSFSNKPNINLTNATPIKNYKNNIAKTTITRPGNRSLFAVTVFFSPEFVSSDVKDDHPRYREDDKNQIKNNEQPQSSSSYGILLDYKLGNNWTLQSGVSFLKRVTEINAKTIYARPDNRGIVNYRLSCSAGSAFVPLRSGTTPALGDSTKITYAKNTLQYISIPLVIKYTIGKSKLTFIPGIGISDNILSKGKVETAVETTAGDENLSTDKIVGLKSNFINAQISFGAEYLISKKIGLNFTPAARLALSSINKNEAVKTKLNSFGLSGGVVIKL